MLPDASSEWYKIKHSRKQVIWLDGQGIHLWKCDTVFSERADVMYEYYNHCMVIQNITVCMQVHIVPTADPVLPDSIATNFAM
jgi:hypothetical protein